MQKRLNKLQLGLILCSSFLLIVLDQLSKVWVRNNFTVGESGLEVGIIRITHVTNSGASFGFFSNQSTVLSIVNIIIVIGIIIVIRYLPCITKLNMIAAGLVIGGAIGNLSDRFQFGYITDFIDIRLWGNFHWPVFNLADSAIVIGTAVISISLVLSSIQERRHEQYS